MNWENQLAVYRIARFATADMGTVEEVAEAMRNSLEGLGADFVGLVSHGNGKGVVSAKHPDQAAFDAASETASKVFAEMNEAGMVERDSVHPHAGEVFTSFQAKQHRAMKGSGAGRALPQAGDMTRNQDVSAVHASDG